MSIIYREVLLIWSGVEYVELTDDLKLVDPLEKLTECLQQVGHLRQHFHNPEQHVGHLEEN